MVKSKSIWQNFRNLKENLSPRKVEKLKADNTYQRFQSDYKSNFTGNSLKKLGVYTSRESHQLISPAVSRFSQSYYDDFELVHVPPANKFPFYVNISNDDIVSVAQHPSSQLSIDDSSSQPNLQLNEHELVKGVKTHKVIIDYYTENDFIIINQLLTDLDRQILLFIATFRHVQFLQIVKETGAKTKQVRNSLDRLHKFYLVDKWYFKRDPQIEGAEVAGKQGESYSIFSNGTTYLMIMNLISREFAYKWREILKEKDRFTPIRCWKVVDAYLSLRLKEGFVRYVPFHYMKSFEYTVQVQLPEKKQSSLSSSNLSEQARQYAQSLTKDHGIAKSRVIERRMKVPELRFNGQFQVKNKQGDIVFFDLYPFVTMSGEHSDMDNLWDVFRHFGHLKDGLDEHGDKHLLLIIVDSIEQIQLINDKYGVNESYDGLDNILFLDLKESSTKNMLSALKVLMKESGEHVLRTTRFNLNDFFLTSEEERV